MNIEKLENVKRKYDDTFRGESQTWREMYTLDFMQETINIFKELTKNMDDRWREYTYYDDTLKELNKRVKKLEQKDSYYPIYEGSD